MRSPQHRRIRGEPRVEVDPLVEMPHLNVAGLLLFGLVGELAEPLRRHPEEVDELFVVSVVHEDLHKALDEPRPLVVVPHGDEPGDGGVGDDHVLPGGTGLVDLAGGGEGHGVHALAVPPLPRDLARGGLLVEGRGREAVVSLSTSACLEK